jgi:hypothetical protein
MSCEKSEEIEEPTGTDPSAALGLVVEGFKAKRARARYMAFR